MASLVGESYIFDILGCSDRRFGSCFGFSVVVDDVEMNKSSRQNAI
jgi:hypothetical protein